MVRFGVDPVVINIISLCISTQTMRYVEGVCRMLRQSGVNRGQHITHRQQKLLFSSTTNSVKMLDRSFGFDIEKSRK